MKKTESLVTQDCSTCAQKEEILNKYEKLIKLYQKKQVKFSGSNQSQTSHILSHQSCVGHPQLRTIKMVSLLQSFTRNRVRVIFDHYKQRSAKKLALLSLITIAKKYSIQEGFGKIYKNYLSSVEKDFDIPQQKIIKNESLKIISGTGQNIDYKQGSLVPQKQKIKLIKQGISEISLQLNKGDSKNLKNYQKNMMEIQIINKKLVAEVKYLKQCLHQSNRRQEKENQKKKDSLEMLAQELYQKNDIINELQKSIKVYERKYEPNGNILEQDTIQLRKDVDHLEIVRDKLNDQLCKLRNKIQKNIIEISQKQQKIMELSEQNKNLWEYKLNNQTKEKSFEELNANLEKLIGNFSKKFKKLAIYENQCEKQKNVTQISSSILDQIKTELVLQFIANITCSHYQLKGTQFFDEQQRDFLQNHKRKYLNLIDEANMFNKTHFFEQVPQFEQIQARGIDEVECNNSMFSVIDKPQQKTVKQCFSDRQGVTIKILQIELEKAKHIQKISELKQKIMHIRNLIINLLKALQIQQSSLKQDAQGVLRVIFDMFEYSEEERLMMFPKKKKIFGFI